MLKRNLIIACVTALCLSAQANAKSVPNFDFSDKALDALTGEDVAGEKLREKQESQKKKKEDALWDQNREGGSFFDKKKRDRTAADVKKEEEAKHSYKKTTFKRRRYAGPTYKAAAEAAAKKAVENFKTFLPAGDFEFKYESEKYHPSADALIIKNVKFVPKEDSPDAKKIPYYLTAKEIKASGFNLGRIFDRPQNETGLLVFSDVDFPIYNEKNVKSGLIKINRVEARGQALALLKNRQGALSSLGIAGLRNEKIINEIVFNDVVRSKIFALRFGTFYNVTIPKGFVENLKQQTIEGLTFSSATVDTIAYTSPEAVQANIVRYSARVFDAEKLTGARIEAAKKQRERKNTDEQFRKNAKIKESAVKEIEKQLRP